jgi:hypothetical protein
VEWMHYSGRYVCSRLDEGVVRWSAETEQWAL